MDVVIVGAGPAGLTAACALRARGIDVIVIDAAAEGANTSRAAVIHPRTLEVLEPLGVTAPIVEEGVRVPEFTVRDGGRILGRLDFRILPTPYPFTVMLPQSRTEAILTGRLRELGGEVHRGLRVTDVAATTAGAQVVAIADDGSTRRIDSTFVIGSDGANSIVRQSQGIDFPGARYEQSFVLADVLMDWPLARDEVQLFFSPQGLVVVAPLPGGHHRVVATVETAPEHPDLADIAGLLDARGPGATTVREVTWSSRFRVHHRLATAYRAGPVVLAGDAAHVHSPAGGQGMNTGIQDAVDLAGTLGRALANDPDPEGLDGYEGRRRPVARSVVSLTDRMTRAATVESAPMRAVRNVAVSTALRVPQVRRALALRIAELR
ncbi:FAD-dependent oxidoreductase [Frondihabitans sucicola]|uniref:FAD-dependent oxidoreductase n=1 Tax=Frondihabitans sucicola TaxID=1268041 RepID=UPI00257362CC|nr:FAD-dependent oxidoreductase [Frondihabitans sucicola]